MDADFFFRRPDTPARPAPDAPGSRPAARRTRAPGRRAVAGSAGSGRREPRGPGSTTGASASSAGSVARPGPVPPAIQVLLVRHRRLEVRFARQASHPVTHQTGAPGREHERPGKAARRAELAEEGRRAEFDRSLVDPVLGRRHAAVPARDRQITPLDDVGTRPLARRARRRRGARSRAPRVARERRGASCRLSPTAAGSCTGGVR